MTVTDSGTSIIELIVRDHGSVKALLNRFDGLAAGQRQDYFCEVVHELIRHEVAEELVLYPALRADARQGGAQADLRIGEQSKAEQMLSDMQDLDPGSEEFTARFLQLREAVLEHAAAEEDSTLPLLGEAETPQKLRDLGSRYERARASAPTHPHPHSSDTPPANRILGPVAAVVDRARHAMSKG